MNDLIDRQQAIDAIESIDWYHQNRNKDMVSGANSLEHQAWYKAEDVYQALELLPSAQPEPQWIPCSERLPEEERKEYWICTDTGYQCECRWTNVNHFWTDLTTSWHWHIMDVPQYAKVVAWMPLPEPYKGVKE